MSQENQDQQQQVPALEGKPAKPVRLNKDGKPRQPHIMTEARSRAFAECRRARDESLKAKRLAKQQLAERRDVKQENTQQQPIEAN